MNWIDWQCIEAFLYKWQTLAASLLALGVAIWTVLAIKRQIRLQQRSMNSEKARHADAQRSRGLAARAELNDALSDISRYAKTCARRLTDEEEASLPERPTEAINAVKRAIEFVDPDSAQSLFELVSKYQVHNARILGGRERINHAVVGQKVYDAIHLYAMTGRLFPFARQGEETLPKRDLTYEEMWSALQICTDFDPVDNDQALNYAMELIKRRHK